MMRVAIIGVVGSIIVALIGAIVKFYQITVEPDVRRWSLPSEAGRPGTAHVIDGNEFSYEICYSEGDGEFIYIDASNSLPAFPSYTGSTSNYPRIKRGECEVVTPGDSSNIGLFLDVHNGASVASGTRERISD